MLRSSVLLTLGLILAGVSAEYVWTGTEWKWNEPGASQVPEDTLGGHSNGGGSSIEGSGGDDYDDDEDYDEDDYNYEDDDDYTGKSNSFDVVKTNNEKYNPGNSAILPATDDEDMIDGSGNDGFNVGSGGYNDRVREPVTQPPKREPEVIKEEDYTYDDDDDYDEDDYDEDDYDNDGDISFGDPDYDNIHNIDVQMTPRTTPFAYPAPTAGPTTRKPTKQYTEAPEVHKKGVPNNRPASFFAQPGILAAVIGGAVVGLLCAILLVMFIVYRMRKKDEGSYALDEPKRSHNANSYSKPPSREFYA